MPTEKRLARINDVLSQRQEGVIILEDIQDPHNAQAVVRTCDAFGFQKVCLIFEKVEKFNPKQIGNSSSSGSNKWLDFEVWDSTEKCLTDLKKRGYVTYATLLNPTAKPMHTYDFTAEKIALMFGNETHGLSPTAEKLADHRMFLSMRGMVESLNLSVTAALCMFEVDRQRRAAGVHRALSFSEIASLRKRWTTPDFSSPQK